jgi:hypothetical protein
VHYPDGRTTTGLGPHIAELKPMFVFAPDTRIKVHPIKIAQGNLTSVSGIIEGTFTQPMPIGGGKTIPQTNKTFQAQHGDRRRVGERRLLAPSAYLTQRLCIQADKDLIAEIKAPPSTLPDLNGHEPLLGGEIVSG